MATFITLTDRAGNSERVNADRIVRYFPHGSGTTAIYGRDHDEWYRETPEQIAALLGVTESPAVAALDDLIGWVFKTHGESWDSVTTPGPVVAACFALHAARGE